MPLLAGCSTEVDYSVPAGVPDPVVNIGTPTDVTPTSETAQGREKGSEDSIAIDSTADEIQLETQDIVAGIVGSPTEASEPAPTEELQPADETPLLDDGNSTRLPEEQQIPPARLPADGGALPTELQNDRYAPALFGGLVDQAVPEQDASPLPSQPSAAEPPTPEPITPASPTNTSPSTQSNESDNSGDRDQPSQVQETQTEADDDWGEFDQLIGAGSRFATDKPTDKEEEQKPSESDEPISPEPSIELSKETKVPVADAQATDSVDNANTVTPIELDPKNTRHLAWLLGAKAAVVTIADLGGVNAARQSAWQVELLANLLGVARPNDVATLASSPTPEAAIATLIRQARTTATQLTKQHGADHAALMEIALKTNALLVLYESRPEVAAAVLQAIRTATDQAGLPSETLTQLTDTLDRRGPAGEVYRSVHRVHRTVERLLREER